MQCNICPLYSSWNNESDSGEACALFGDGWDSQFQYERNNQIWGCYIEKAYINKVEQRIEKHRAEEVKAFLESEGNMTNKEKFIKVFNQEPDDTICPIYCSSNGKSCPFYCGFRTYGKCEAGDWWNMEYKAESEDT